MAPKIRISIQKSVPENAEFYYKESKKAKEKLKGARKALEETQKKIDELMKRQEIAISEGYVPERKKVKKRMWYEKFRWFYSGDSFLVVGGKDSTTNEILIKKYLEKDDLVFHADIHGAPFVIIKNPDKKKIPEGTLKEASIAGASYSKAWKLGLGSCDVYYVNPEQVSKKAPSGEYLGKGAFMIYGKKEWFRGVKLEIGIGFKIYNSETEVIGGPVSSIEANSKYYVKIVTGDKKSGELAREIKELILEKSKKGDREKIKKVSLQEIQKWIPGGKGKILR